VAAAIEVRDLVKTYRSTRAVDEVSFDVAEGEVIAILGPNGAGKSTTIEILEGHRERTAGHVRVLGVDPADGGRAFRDRIGIVLQSSGIDPELTVREVVDMYGAAYSKGRPSSEVIELVDLVDKADDRIVSLSGGQQRRVDLALGLIGDPELIFLDEPTTGFDPAARRRSWALVENLTSLGRTVVLTTHYLDEAEHLADRVIVLAGGRVVAEGTPAELRADTDRQTRIAFTLPSVAEPLSGLLEQLGGEVVGRGHGIEIITGTPTADLAHITGWAMARGIELDGLTVESPDLEDVYLRLVGEADGVDDGDVASE
jgi:ABC-2 type transport system ATP-binding protein